MYFPLIKLPSNAIAPVIPASSSTVKRTSKAGWGISLDASIASPIATAIPLSAPKVVLFAYT